MSERKWCKMGDFRGFFFPKDENLGVLKSIRVQLRVWGWAGVGACGGEGVGGRPDPPDGRESGPDFSLRRDLSSTSVSTGLPRAERWMVDFQSISERKWCKMDDFRGLTIVKVSISRFSNRKWGGGDLEGNGCFTEVKRVLLWWFFMRLFTIGKVSIDRFSNREWTKRE